ncbi:hypothetical protein CPC16_010768 [Podila verticillata]|nr:hypothetical protein CPC16_010768 [Podila verticillata]
MLHKTTEHMVLDDYKKHDHLLHLHLRDHLLLSNYRTIKHTVLDDSNHFNLNLRDPVHDHHDGHVARFGTDDEKIKHHLRIVRNQFQHTSIDDPIPPRPPKPTENILPLAYPASPPIKPSDHEHTKREIRRHHHEVLHFRWPAIRPPSPGIVGRYTPYTHASLFGTMMDNALTFSALQRAVGTVQGFNERHYWFDRNRRHSFPEERNMGIVWSPVLVPSEDETMEEDEIMETGQAIGYPPIAREVASAPEEDLWMEGHEGNALVGEVSIAPATEEEGNEVMEVGQADGYVPPEVQVTSGTQAMEDSQVGDAPEEPYYSPGSPPEVVSPEPLEQPKQGQEEEVATSGSEQPTWTEDGDITTDLEMLPRQPVYGMRQDILNKTYMLFVRTNSVMIYEKCLKFPRDDTAIINAPAPTLQMPKSPYEGHDDCV